MLTRDVIRDRRARLIDLDAADVRFPGVAPLYGPEVVCPVVVTICEEIRLRRSPELTPTIPAAPGVADPVRLDQLDAERICASTSRSGLAAPP